MNENNYDIAVVGGGPAGMMAAGTAAGGGAEVVLVEKNRVPGKKLMITGKGRCNLTNAGGDIDHLISTFGKNGKFLYPSFNCLDPSYTIDFFSDIGLETKIERGGRVFPVSDKAVDVQKALVDWIRKQGVTVLTGTTATGFSREGNRIESLDLREGRIRAKNYILCTGGKSYPRTGSTGEGYLWAKELGHSIIEPVPRLTDIKLDEPWIRELEGMVLKNINATVIKEGKKIGEKFGEAFFTSEGIDGPVILDLSRPVRENRESRMTLRIDLKPALEIKKLDSRILREMGKGGGKSIEDLLRKLLPEKFVPVIRDLSGITPGKRTSEISREERKKIISLLKSLEMTVTGTGGFERAVVTGGGVPINEIDPRTLRSKIVENLFFAGEIIDVDGITGGYNLQACWSTGRLAGLSAIPQPS